MCSACGTVTPDVNVPISVGARAHAEYCPVCSDEGNYHRMEPIVAIGRMSVFSDASGAGGAHDFTKFALPVEDPGSPTGWKTEAIDSLADIRRVERESEQRAANGEGQVLRWRDYSNDSSNRDVCLTGPAPDYTPSKHYLNGTPVTIRRGDPVIADHGTVEDSEA